MVRPIISLEHEVEAEGPDIPSKSSGESLKDLVKRVLAEGVLSSAVVYVSKAGRPVMRVIEGNRIRPESNDHELSPVASDTVFDIGTGTATIATTSLLMRLFQAGKFRLEDRVSRFLQSMGVAGKSGMTMEHLLAHTAGLPAAVPFYDELVRLNSGPRLGMLASSGAKQFVYDQILKIPLKGEPGVRYMWSELSSMLLGQICEQLSAQTLDRAFIKLIGQPLRMRTTSYVDLSVMKQRGYQPATELFAASGECPRRQRLLCGELHDPTAWAMGGVSGHAGLFSVAADLEAWALEFLKAYHGTGDVFTKETVETFWQVGKNSLEAKPYALGWECAGKENGLLEAGLSSNTFGVTGDTGSSVWIDVQHGLTIVLLTNTALHAREVKRYNAVHSELLFRIAQFAANTR